MTDWSRRPVPMEALDPTIQLLDDMEAEIYKLQAKNKGLRHDLAVIAAEAKFIEKASLKIRAYTQGSVQ